jgi:hypothetical protein
VKGCMCVCVGVLGGGEQAAMAVLRVRTRRMGV